MDMRHTGSYWRVSSEDVKNKSIKSVFVEIVLKIVDLAVTVDSIVYWPCVMEFTAGLWERQKIISH